jgi:chaperonin GroEL
VGKAGVITIEEGKSTETTIEMVEGMQFDRGYVSAYFCTDAEKMIAQMTNPKILITDKKISSVQEIINILQTVATTASELLIIADDIEGDALSALVINKLRGTLKVCAVKAPGFGDRRKAMLQDLAILTGASFISEEAGSHLKDAGIDMLGSAEKVTVFKDKTTIVAGGGSSEHIQSRIKQIESEMKLTDSSYDKEKLQERKAKLSGGVAVIRVGAPTEPEMKQKKQMFEDSLSSTRAAIEEGILPGGGVALMQAADVISGLQLSPEEMLGAQITQRACSAPLKQIITNTGYDSSVILEQLSSQGPTVGFNAQSEKVEDLIGAGVIDPAKVVKNALIFASSTAGIVLLSEALIGNAEEEAEKK